jgi:hypothetical protein
VPGTAPITFAGGAEQLHAELDWLDLLVARAVRAQRLVAPAGPPDPIGYVGDAEVDRLLTGPRAADVPPDPALEAQLTATRGALDDAAARSRGNGVELPLTALAERFGLTAFERAALLICLAPELDRRYDRLYAALQDDIARCRPSVELVTALLEPAVTDRWRARRHLGPAAPLRAGGLLRVVFDGDSPSGSTALAELLQVAPRVVGHLLGDRALDDELRGLARLVDPVAGTGPSDPGGRVADRLAELVRRHAAASPAPLLLHLHGRYGAGRAELACAVAARLGRQLVELDLAVVPAAELDGMIEATLRDSRLIGAVALLRGADRLLGEADQPHRTAFGAALTRHPGLVLLTAERPWPTGRPAGHAVLHEVEVPDPGAVAGREQWTGVALPSALRAELAGRFRLTPGQIRDVAADVRRRSGDADPPPADWYAGCRRASGRGLAALARQIVPRHGWADLVLDQHRVEQLRALRDQVRHRARVLDEWGLGRRIASGRGLTALFTGPPGTGKTMAAGVVAADLGLDLYRVDLAQVVSKYVGETEKNLARIFTEAQASDAVLLFDEADALFGKRTEVADAHDRYANIEVSYLLTRMEDYEGVAVLSSNLAQNLDEAFLRRLRFVVEFPFPDAAARHRIWATHLATGAPLADDIDLGRLAQRLPLAGGSIRNIVLAASFLAAADDAPLGMDQLVRAARQELDKTGALWPDLGDPVRREVLR